MCSAFQILGHLIMVPNRRIPTLNEATEADSSLLGHMLLTASKEARQEGIAETGYRLAINTNEDAGQSAFHLHLHILGGATTGAMVDQGWRSVRRLADSTLTSTFEMRILGIWTTMDLQMNHLLYLHSNHPFISQILKYSNTLIFNTSSWLNPRLSASVFALPPSILV